jgi:caffeoyl-CoA O-methyltransferase
MSRSSGPDPLQLELQAVTEEKAGPASVMQIGDDQAVLMETLARAMGAKAAVEIGTFTGYSSLALARGMSPEGRLLCCDVNREWTAVARQFWERAGVADRIELRIGPALDTLRGLPLTEQFDLAFIDADKDGYPAYYEELLPRVRLGGLILADNTLQAGGVIDPEQRGDAVAAIRSFNDRAAGDERVRVVMLPIGDGVSVIQRIV